MLNNIMTEKTYKGFKLNEQKLEFKEEIAGIDKRVPGLISLIDCFTLRAEVKEAPYTNETLVQVHLEDSDFEEFLKDAIAPRVLQKACRTGIEKVNFIMVRDETTSWQQQKISDFEKFSKNPECDVIVAYKSNYVAVIEKNGDELFVFLWNLSDTSF